ncbi:CGNR zinc finger domain-containing protein [Streptomyces sp. NBC_01497]|uniref:CGNR zinc finger domain-containing protein n=1 Tax=Streptomyces sp. NBC_01497 TaxID=2903885 RepID=UPI002E37D93D|nr:ABATE domain-containing protein [Streptomyces sp. NBC_01497]
MESADRESDHPAATATPVASLLLGEPLPVELMNTVWADREGVHDALAPRDDGSAGADAWLLAVAPRLSLHPATPPDGRPPATTGTESFTRLRDALRRLAAEATADTRPGRTPGGTDLATAVRVLNEACAGASAWSRLAWAADGEPHRHRLAAGDVMTRALAEIAEEAVLLFAGPDREQLRACYAPGCVRYFVRDHPRRQWCSAGCGNRARVGRHYRRHHGRGGGA